MALVLGYYKKENLGDEQYQISIPRLLKKSGFTGNVRFENPNDISVIPSDIQIVICGGGDIVNDYFQLKISKLIKYFRGPVIALSIGITYPSTIKDNYIGFYDAIVLRHFAYMDEISKVVGASCVSSIPDVGFSLPRQIAAKFHKPRIGVFLANGAVHKSDIPIIKSTLQHFSKSYEIVLYQMNTSYESHEGDHFINAKLGFTEAPCLTVPQIMSHIGGLTLAVCMRYHSNVFSIVQGVPFVSWTVRPKSQFLMEDHEFTQNVCTTVHGLQNCIQYALDNLESLTKKVISIRDETKEILDSFVIPLVKRSLPSIVAECQLMSDPEKIANYALLHTVGTTVNKYRYGFLENLSKKADLLEMLKWLVEDATPKLVSGLKFLQPVSQFSGVHRSGWEAASKILKVLESEKGTLCDLYVDSTFHWNQSDLIAKGVLPFKQKWIGFIHHTPLEEYTPYNTTALFQNPVFLRSLKHCKCLILLSTSLANFVRKKLVAFPNVQVKVVKHPTEIVHQTFDLRRWLDNPVITQVGAWLRDPYAIYRLRLPWGIKQTLEGPKMESYTHPKQWFIVNTSSCTCVNSNDTAQGCMSRPNMSRDCNTTVMTKYMTEYIKDCKGPSFSEVRSGTICCEAGQYWPSNWNYKIEKLKKILQINFDSVTKITNLSHQEYDKLLTNSVVFLNLLDCSAANTIIECITRNTPVIVNTLPACIEYLGLSYPGYYNSMDTVWHAFNPSKIYAANEYLKKMDKTVFQLDWFLKEIEDIVKFI